MLTRLYNGTPSVSAGLGLTRGCVSVWGGHPGLSAGSSSSGSVFSPEQLFMNGEVGLWLDPYDIGTMFQDHVGTVPVTRPGQPVRLMLDKSRGLIAGPELVQNGGFSDDAQWDTNSAWTIAGGEASVGNSDLLLSQPALIPTVGTLYEVTFTITRYTSGGVRVVFGGETGITRRAPGTYTQCLVAVNKSAFGLFPQGLSTLAVSSVSVREVPGNHVMQYTAANAPVLTADGDYRFLRFNGSSSYMYCPRLNLSGVDSVSIFAGVQRYGSAFQMLAEMSSNASNTNAAFYLSAGADAGAIAASVDGYASYTSTGTYNPQQAAQIAAPAPDRAVISATHSRGALASNIRRNGVDGVATTGPSVGPFIAQSLFLGKRGGSSAAFNGCLYGFILRGGAVSAPQPVEDWLNARTAAY